MRVQVIILPVHPVVVIANLRHKDPVDLLRAPEPPLLVIHFIQQRDKGLTVNVNNPLGVDIAATQLLHFRSGIPAYKHRSWISAVIDCNAQESNELQIEFPSPSIGQLAILPPRQKAREPAPKDVLVYKHFLLLPEVVR